MRAWLVAAVFVAACSTSSSGGGDLANSLDMAATDCMKTFTKVGAGCTVSATCNGHTYQLSCDGTQCSCTTDGTTTASSFSEMPPVGGDPCASADAAKNLYSGYVFNDTRYGCFYP